MTINERAAYVQGLFEGYGIDSKEKEGRILSEMLSLISDMADKITALESECGELRDYIEELDEDLGFVEETVFETEEDEDEELTSEEDDGFYEVECPSCGETVYFDDSLESDSLVCPVCGEKVMDFDVCDEDCEGCDGDCASCKGEE